MAGQKMIKVRYTHSGSEMTSDLDGKQYCFSKRNGEMVIPMEVYIRVVQSKHVNAENLEPVYEDTTKFQEQIEELSIEVETKASIIAEQARDIKLLQSDNKKLRKKPNK